MSAGDCALQTDSELSNISASSLTPSTSALLLDSTAHLAYGHAAEPTAKPDRRRSLGLIDAARVFTKDFQSLVRSNNKSHRFRTVLSVQTHAPGDSPSAFPAPDKDLDTRLETLDAEMMEIHAEERHGRGLGMRIVNFLSRSRSRSRSKKRRSRSLDGVVVHPPMPGAGSSLSAHARHLSAENVAEMTGPSTSGARPRTRSVSRPLSSTTTATDTTIKPRYPTSPPLQSSSKSRPAPTHSMSTPVPIPSSSKGKKMNIFGLSISTPRKASFGDTSKGKSTPPTPRTAPAISQPSSYSSDRPLLAAGLRQGSGSASSHGSSRHPKADYDAEPLPPAPVDGRNAYAGRSVRANVAPGRSAPVHLLSTRAEPSEETDAEAELTASDLGRCSPLCGLGPARPSSRARGSRERQGSKDGLRWKEKEREREHGYITHPMRVGSPVPRERESRSTIGAAPMEKVASGSGAKPRTRDATPNSNAAAIAARAKRTKHGSFDFERPVSANAVMSTEMKAALNQMGIGTTPPDAAPPIALQRSASSRAARREADARIDRERQQQLRSQPSATRTRPTLDLNTNGYFLTRRPTNSSSRDTPRVQRQHSRGHSQPTDSDREPPSSPVSSQSQSSGVNSSWGKAAGKRMARAAHGPFKFEPAVPPIPGSPADDRKRTPIGAGAAGQSSPLGPSRHTRSTTVGKGRSLDLGLGLSWAPSRVREEAVLHVGSVPARNNSYIRTRARWRAATVDEEGRLSADGSAAATDVAAAFREVLGDAAYATFKNYVHRFDAQAIPLDGPFGLLLHVERLLDSAPGLDERGKRVLLDRFAHIVQKNQ